VTPFLPQQGRMAAASSPLEGYILLPFGDYQVSEETKTFAGFTTTGRLQRKNINEYLRTLDLGSFSGLTESGFH
jgi:hypothetical protein